MSQRCFTRTGAVAAVTLAAGLCQAASVYDDDFADGAVGPQWSTLSDNPSRLSLSENNGRLNLLATPGGSPNDDALYLSNFRLSTAADFVIRLDYAFTDYTEAGGVGTAVGLVFGVGRDSDGTDSAAIGQGVATRDFFGNAITAFGGTIAYRTDDITSTPVADPFSAPTGTFEISYNAAGDDLTLRRVGSGMSYTLTDTVRQVWQADDLLVSFGGRGSGFGVNGGAFADNFTVVSGSVIPEPMVGLIGLALLALGGRRFRGGV